MGVSLADQAGAPSPSSASLAVALGANLPSPAGEPLATLVLVRPLLETVLGRLGQALRWSPLFRTAPVGGPPDQPDYLNAVVLVSEARPATAEGARTLLADLQGLEQRFGRQRRERWGARCLDLDLLWWGGLRCSHRTLALPHPRLLERRFVLEPLAAIEAALVPPGAAVSLAELLGGWQAATGERLPEQLPGRLGWPE